MGGEDAASRYCCYYVHDITTTSLSNRELLAYCTRNRIDLGEVAADLRHHIARCCEKRTDVVVLQCYEWDGATVRQDAKHLVTVVGEKYTHYVEDAANGTSEMSRAEADGYDFERGRYQRNRYRKESYFSEQESNVRVIELVRGGTRVYGNSHKFINEFCYNLYRRHLDERDFKGRLIRTKPSSRAFTFPLLMRRPYVERETVLFGGSDDIEVVDDSAVDDFHYRHKTLSLDIETIMVDASGAKIRDRIIQISLVYQEGGRLRRCVGITVGGASRDPDDYQFENMKGFFDNDNDNDAIPTTEIFCVENERRLIEKFVEVVAETKPDYIAGYNVIGFDLPVLLKSADRYKKDLVEELSHVRGFDANSACIRRSLEASAKRRKDADDAVSTLEDNGLFRLSYALFPGVLVNDLYRCHKGEKLDELARSALGIGKEDVSYVEIPRLYYSDRESDRSKLMKYNVVDSLLCAALINVKDDFVSYKFFVTSSYASKVPHSEFFGMQKTPLILPMFYYAFKKIDMLQDAKIKPLRESHKLCVEQVLRHFLYDQPCSYSAAKEVVEKFRSGEIKTKTVAKQFSFDPDDPDEVDILAAIDALKRQFESARRRNGKHGSQFYTLTHLMLYVRYLTTQTQTAAAASFDIEGLIGDFYKTARLGRYAAADIAKWSKSGSGGKSAIAEEKKLTRQLAEFLRYLSGRNVSSTHTVTRLVDDFCENEMIDTKYRREATRFATYLNAGDGGSLRKEFADLLPSLSDGCDDRRQRLRFTDSHAPDTFCEAVWRIVGDNILMKFDTPSKYDGAWVCLPNPGVEFEKPVCCVDFSSLYPTLGIAYNVGPETILSRRTILKNSLREGFDYETINIYARDDHKKVDVVRNLSDDEVGSNYACFLKRKHAKSVYSEVWEDILENRLKFKRQIGTFARASDNKRVKEMSDTFKISANSVYGVLPHMGQWRISAAITSRGRQNIRNVARDIEETHGGVTMYGDTDSVMFHLNMTTDQLCRSYDSGELLSRGWVTAGEQRVDDCDGDDYKRGCLIAAAVSTRITEEMNGRHLTAGGDRTTIYFPPCQLDHEKVMLPFVIFAQKHYFAKIMDDDVTQPYILRGLECRKRTKLQATDDVENAMFADLLQRNPCTWNTYRLASEIVSRLISGSVNLTKIASRKKITVTATTKRVDAGADLCRRMKERGELVDTGGLDKISVNVIKVENGGGGGGRVKYESLDYMSKRQRDELPLGLDAKAIARQILTETVKIMSVVHPRSTCSYFEDLLRLKVDSFARREEFAAFVTPAEAMKQKQLLHATRSKPPPRLLNETIFNYFSSQRDDVENGKRKTEDAIATAAAKKFKRAT